MDKIKNITTGWVKEFKEFALKGNVIDMAVGVIIGGAFGIVHSIYQGKEIAPVELRWFVTDSKVEETAAPKEKMLSEYEKASLSAGNNNTAPADGFMNIPDGVDEEVPFN